MKRTIIEKKLAEGEKAFPCQDFKHEDLSDLDFSGTTLTKCNFSYCNLSNCKFDDANLRDSIFCYANMEYVDMYRADISGANFEYANVRKTMSSCEIFKSIPGGTWPIVLHNESVRVGCQTHSYKKWVNFSKEEIKEMDKKAEDYYPMLISLLQYEYRNLDHLKDA